MKPSTRTLIRDLIKDGISLVLTIWLLSIIIRNSYRMGYKQGVIDMAHAIVKRLEGKKNDSNK